MILIFMKRRREKGDRKREEEREVIKNKNKEELERCWILQMKMDGDCWRDY